MLNVVCLMGRLVSDPELRHTANDISVTGFTLAVDRAYTPKGQDRQVDFIDIVAWRSTADFVCKYFRKGQLVAVQGSIQTRSYTDKEGNKRKAFEIVADQAHFAESKKDGNNSPSARHEEQPQYAGQDTGDFEEIPDDSDLPF